MGIHASLLVQQLDKRLASMDTMLKYTWLCIAVILIKYEALRDMCTFAFVVAYLFSLGGRNATSVVDLVCLI